jgi:archaeoflavoprotein AfpA
LEPKKKKVAWGITGGGEGLEKAFAVMREMRKKHEKNVEIWVYLSKAGEQVTKMYGILDSLKQNFDKVFVESNSNVPFLAGQLQVGKFAFLLVAPATSNTVAKVAVGIGDTMLSNAIAMGLKSSVPVYLMPTDFKKGVTMTKLPDGRELKLNIRREDVANVEKLEQMVGLNLIEKPKFIKVVFEEHFGVK